MTNLLAWPYFQWIGLIVVAVAATAVLVCAVVLVVVLFAEYGPKVHCRAPDTEMIVSTFRGDVRTGEGQRVKCAADLKISHIIGLSWRTKLIFGLLRLEKDDPPCPVSRPNHRGDPA